MHAVCSRSNLTRAAACISLLATAAAVHAEERVLHVDDDAAPGGDGLSWATAFRSLSDALEVVNSSYPHVSGEWYFIKVAQGTYVPNQHMLGRLSTFIVLSGTTLFGGFAGISASNPDERDPQRFISVLSGDLNGDDLPGFINRSDNVYHVVTFGRPFGGGYVHGFTIRGGQADGEGPDSIGGGVTAHWDGVLWGVDSCRITDNFAARGGALGMTSGFSFLYNCTVDSNFGAEAGGAASVCSATFISCRFVGNTASETDGAGGAISIIAGIADMIGCEFSGNTAGAAGGAVAILGGVLRLSGCSFSRNTATDGLAIYVDSPYALVESCAFDGGSDVPGQIVGVQAQSLNVQRCVVRGGANTPSLLSGSSPIAWTLLCASPRFVDPLGLDGVVGTLDDDLRLSANSAAIDCGVYRSVWDSYADLSGLPRVHDDPGMPNIGIGAGGAMDIGAHEFQGTSCRADYDGDTVISVPDIFAFLTDWFAQRADADFDRDRVVEVSDIFAYLSAWFAGCG